MGTIAHMSYIKVVGLTDAEKKKMVLAAVQADMSLSRYCWGCIRLASAHHSTEFIRRWADSEIGIELKREPK